MSASRYVIDPYDQQKSTNKYGIRGELAWSSLAARMYCLVKLDGKVYGWWVRGKVRKCTMQEWQAKYQLAISRLRLELKLALLQLHRDLYD